MRSRFLLYFLLLFATLTACTKDEEIAFDLDARLTFSSDSVVFDTVFTAIGSTNRRFKIYNQNAKAIMIDHIELAGGASSSFSLNINGIATNEAKRMKLNGKDSLNIFVKVNINPNSNDLPFIVQDTLRFIYNGQKHAVQLIAYGQNAIFINGAILNTNTVWEGKLPYIIYKSVTVTEGAQLTIKPGTRVLFHGKSTLSVMGTLHAMGTKKDSILFASDRLEQIYAEESGQWNGIHLYPESKDSKINYAVIKNGIAGLTVDSLSTTTNPKLLLTNSVVKNMEVVGFLGYQTELTAINNLFFNCGQYLVYGAGGGKYDLKHNTFAGYTMKSLKKTPSVYLSDFISSTQSANLFATLYNNIIWGSQTGELVFEKKSNVTVVNMTVKNNLIKSINNAFGGNGNILNVDPQFSNVERLDFRLAKSSPANNKGADLRADPYFKDYIYRDKQNILRLIPSEIGCYENN